MLLLFLLEGRSPPDVRFREVVSRWGWASADYRKPDPETTHILAQRANAVHSGRG